MRSTALHWVWLLLTLAITAVAVPVHTNTPWPCPGSDWYGGCYTPFVFALSSNPYSSPNSNCSNCKCRYGDYQMNDSEHECVSCAKRVPPWTGLNMIAGTAPLVAESATSTPGMDSVCTNMAYFVCAEGFYSPPDATVEAPCSPCLTGTFVCQERGQSTARCVRAEEPDRICVPCTNPIPDNNTQVYGAQNVKPSCSIFAHDIGLMSEMWGAGQCVLYNTPAYDASICSIACAPGFVNKRLISANDLDTEPECVPCGAPNGCPKGHYCPGGRGLLDCPPCATALPGNASWTDQCKWQCDVGFYRPNGQHLCAPCVSLPCDQLLGGFFTIWIGCGGDTAGGCVNTLNYVTCVDGENYLDASPTAPAPRCLNCSRAELGKTFAANACGNRRDSVIRRCSPPCGNGTFVARNCSLTADVLCLNCSAPPRPGLRLARPCQQFADAVFESCPRNMSCDGGPNASACAGALQRAEDGVCVCPRGMERPAARPWECVPLTTCSNVSFPDPVTGNCTPCTVSSVSGSARHAVVSVKGVLGVGACRCKPGYFVVVVPSSSPSGEGVTCWPCGDLQCKANVQLQTPCYGWHSRVPREPACECSPPPGAVVVNNATCEFRCAPGFSAQAGASQALGIFKARGALLVPGKSVLTLPPMAGGGEISSMAVIAPDVVLLVVDQRLLFVARLYGDVWRVASFDNSILAGGSRRTGGIAEAHVAQYAQPFCAWVSIVYVGQCIDTPPEEVVNCSTVELLRFDDIYQSGRPRVDNWCMPEVGLCALTFYTLSAGVAQYDVWGRDMPLGVGEWGVRGVLAVADTLLLAAGSIAGGPATAMMAYQVQYYAPSETQRAADMACPLMKTVRSSGLCDVRSMAYGMGSLFVVDACAASSAAAPTRVLQLVLEQATCAAEAPLLQVQPQTFPPATAALFSVAPHIVGYLYVSDVGVGQEPAVAVGQVDLWNLYAVEAPGAGVPNWARALSFGFGLLGWSGPGGRSGSNAATACGVDTISYGGQPCAPLQCVRDVSCGPHSMRPAGSSVCACSPGFTGAPCQPCAANHYCPGFFSAPVPCGANSESPAGSSDASACQCSPGHYLQPGGGFCLPCPRGSWCLGKRAPPVACVGHGSNTNFARSTSPLACTCPERTHGLGCVTCTGAESCKTTMQDPSAVAILLRGWGPIDSEALLVQVLGVDAASSAIYSVPLLSPPMTTPMLISKSVLGWAWVVALVVSSAQVQSAEAIASDMLARGFVIAEALRIDAAVLHNVIRVPTPCNAMQEWSDAAQNCVCQQGYEGAYTKTGYAICVPCKNGTVRAALTAGGCYGCTMNRTHAPWLAMSACVCMPGYFSRMLADGTLAECLTAEEAGQAPIALLQALANPMLAVPACAAVGVLGLLAGMLLGG